MSGRSEFDAALTQALARIGVTLSPDAADTFWRHFELVVEANRRVNLTRITDPTEAAFKHYADSLAVLPWAERHRPVTRRLLDVGTGAGFPAIPLAIARPDWHVTAIDATAKKARAVQEFATRLGLGNVCAVHARLPYWCPPEPIDLVLFRATANTGTCLEAARKSRANIGVVACYKTASMPPEEVFDTQAWCRRHCWAVLPRWDYALTEAEAACPRRLLGFVPPAEPHDTT
jgi:16S rRNA (guanine527-N7)-methyltransferase